MARVILSLRRIALYAVTASCFITLACFDDAPRENPLDPEAGRFSPIEGYVLSLFPPHTPLYETVVSAPTLGIADTTSLDGRFRLTYAPPEPVLIVGDSPAHAPSSLLVGTSGNERRDALLYLDALPIVSNPSVLSTYEAQWWPTAYREWVTVGVAASDPDGLGDVDSVFCTLPNGDRIALQPTQEVGKFETILDEVLLGPEGAEGLVGRDLYLKAYDRQGESSADVVSRLVRVVRDVADTLEPAGLDEIGERPTLKWHCPSPAFTAGLRAKVYRVDMGVETYAWESGLLPMGTDSTTVQRILSEGDYYWVVYTVDTFGNRGRSKEATFTVGDEEG